MQTCLIFILQCLWLIPQKSDRYGVITRGKGIKKAYVIGIEMQSFSPSSSILVKKNLLSHNQIKNYYQIQI